jgi:hypothetical protein
VVVNTVWTIVGSATKSSANPNASADAGTKKVEDELPYDGRAEGLYTPMPMDPRVEGKKAEKYVMDRLHSIVKIRSTTVDHASAYETFVEKVLEKG